MLFYEMVSGLHAYPIDMPANVIRESVTQGMRPQLPGRLVQRLHRHSIIFEMLQKAWHPQPSKRPAFRKIGRGILMYIERHWSRLFFIDEIKKVNSKLWENLTSKNIESKP